MCIYSSVLSELINWRINSFERERRGNVNKQRLSLKTSYSLSREKKTNKQLSE